MSHRFFVLTAPLALLAGACVIAPPGESTDRDYRDNDRWDRSEHRDYNDHDRGRDYDHHNGHEHMDRDGFRRNIDRLEQHTAEFRRDLDRALDHSRLDGSHREDDLNRQMKRLEQATDRLKARKNSEDPYEVRDDAASVVEEGRSFESLISASRGIGDAQRGWDNLRGSINELAHSFHLRPIANVPPPRHDNNDRDHDKHDHDKHDHDKHDHDKHGNDHKH